jgi:hypothetical protein
LLQEVQTQLVREESAGGCGDHADETQVVYAAQKDVSDSEIRP